MLSSSFALAQRGREGGHGCGLQHAAAVTTCVPCVPDLNEKWPSRRERRELVRGRVAALNIAQPHARYLHYRRRRDRWRVLGHETYSVTDERQIERCIGLVGDAERDEYVHTVAHDECGAAYGRGYDAHFYRVIGRAFGVIYWSCTRAPCTQKQASEREHQGRSAEPIWHNPPTD